MPGLKPDPVFCFLSTRLLAINPAEKVMKILPLHAHNADDTEAFRGKTLPFQDSKTGVSLWLKMPTDAPKMPQERFSSIGQYVSFSQKLKSLCGLLNQHSVQIEFFRAEDCVGEE